MTRRQLFTALIALPVIPKQARWQPWRSPDAEIHIQTVLDGRVLSSRIVMVKTTATNGEGTFIDYGASKPLLHGREVVRRID